MAQQIRLKRSAVTGKTPLTTDVALGELAINTFDGKMFFKRNNGTESIIELSNVGHTHALGTLTGVVLTSPSTNQVLQFNGTNWVNAAAGSGTVTSVALSGGTTGLTVTGSPITTSGTLTLNTTTAAKTSNTTTLATTEFVKRTFATQGTGGTLDWNDGTNTVPGVGPTLLLGNATNGPTPSIGNYFHPLNIEYAGSAGTGNVTQLAISYGSPGNDMWMRGKYNSVWTSWIQFLNSANLSSYATSTNTASKLVTRDASGNFSAGTITATLFSGSGASLTSIPNSATTATSANTASAIVARDGSGNFTAGTITATSVTGSGATLLNPTYQAAINTTTPGTGTYGLHFSGQSTADFASGITWNGGSTGGQAGIYVQGGSSYGTRMYLATTDAYAAGAKTAISISNVGLVNFVRSRPTALGNIMLDAGNYNSYSPTLTGTGASGTWGINITGTAPTLQTARTLTIAGTGKSFNGSADVSWTANELAAHVFNNTGEGVLTRTSFDATTPSYGFGWRFVAGSTNGPGTGGSQFYSLYTGLGTDYPATGASSYGMQLAIDRNSATPYLSVRFNENNSLGTWRKIQAGNADTATTLQTARTINGTSFNGSANITTNSWGTSRTLSFTGDVTGSSAVDGSANVATAMTLANSGVTAGTHTKVTVDAKGRVTAGTTLAATDIPNLDASKITSGVFDQARLPSYVDDVLEYTNLASFPVTGETGKIYVDLTTNKTYRWSGSTYIYITSGAVDSVAGKTGVVTLVKADVGLSNVDNTADASKNVATAATWTTARTISLGGDLSGSASVNGSADVTITATIGANTVTDADLRDSAALSVIGRSANSSGDPADIAAGTDGHVLRRSGTTLGFGTVSTAGIADGAVTGSKIAASLKQNIVVITSTGTWTSPSNVKHIEVYMFGGGGGGGAGGFSNGINYLGGAGGIGGNLAMLSEVVPNTAYSVTIGSGGAGNNGGDGSAGTATTFLGCTCGGGGAGIRVVTTQNGSNGTPGTVTFVSSSTNVTNYQRLFWSSQYDPFLYVNTSTSTPAITFSYSNQNHFAGASGRGELGSNGNNASGGVSGAVIIHYYTHENI